MLKNKNRLIILLNYFIVFIIFIYVNNKYYDINNILTIVLGNNITSKSLFIERTIYLYHLFINIYIYQSDSEGNWTILMSILDDGGFALLVLILK